MPKDEKRLGVDIPEDLWFELNEHISWGHRKHIYTAITRQLVELLEQAEKPSIIIAMVMDDEITAQDLLQRAQREAHEAKRSQDLNSRDGRGRGAQPGAGKKGSPEGGLSEQREEQE